MALTREEAIAAAQAAWRWPVGVDGGRLYSDLELDQAAHGQLFEEFVLAHFEYG